MYPSSLFCIGRKNQICKINDFLIREIIRESNSPYWIKIIHIKKRKLRWCDVDLHVIDLHVFLNVKVLTQEYPFPIIEDYIACFENKIFTC
jgi:hypothetical protein